MPQSPRRPTRASRPFGIQPKELPAARTQRRIIKRREENAGLDIFHLLAAGFGAFSGLALYSAITPGYVPHGQAEVRASASSTSAMYVTALKGARAEDGMFHVRGQVYNGTEKRCKLASVKVSFFDGGDRLVTSAMATAENVPGRSEKPFEVRASVANAVRFEVAVDLAEF